MIVVLKHIGIEGLGLWEDFFKRDGFALKIIELEKGQGLIGDLSNIGAVISLGGPMNVDEEEKYPFLKAEDVFLKKVLKKKIPFMGVCLGSQLLAKAAGAKVKKAPEKEIGFCSVTLTAEGKRDNFFACLPERLDVFQWHEDTFDLPAKSALLVTSAACPHQAFRLGTCAYGVQFHMEVTTSMVEEWCRAYFHLSDINGHARAEAMVAESRKFKERFRRQAFMLYRNFKEIILETRKVVQ